MKVFAILTAALMAAGGAAYVLEDSSSTCSHAVNCPVAKSAEKPSCCSVPCPACASNCLDCCDVCDECCTADVQEPASAKSATKSDCCAKSDECCLTVAACCTGAEAAMKPLTGATGEATAGISLK